MTTTLIVVPTLGERMDLLDACLASVLGQDTPLRLVVVTTPARLDAVRALVEDRGSVVPQQRPGLSAAINIGWESARAGESLFAWIGDDDLLEPGSLERATAVLHRNPNASMVYGACRIIDQDGYELFVSRPGRLESSWLLEYGSNLIAQPGTVFRRAAVDAVGPLDESLKLAMDLDLFLRLRRWGPLVRTGHVLASYRRHEDTLTLTNFDLSRQEARMVQRRTRRPLPVPSAAEALATFMSRVLHSVDRRRPMLRSEPS